MLALAALLNIASGDWCNSHSTQSMHFTVFCIRCGHPRRDLLPVPVVAVPDGGGVGHWTLTVSCRSPQYFSASRQLCVSGIARRAMWCSAAILAPAQ